MKWLHLSRDVEDCKRNNPPSAGYLRRGLETPLIFQTISMDFVGPRTYGGVEYHYAVILDHGSRYATTQASIGAPTSATACRMLMTTWIAIFGAPAVLITDRERYFDRRFADLVQTELGARWVRTTSGYPQANGMNETIHRSIEKSIAIRVQGREDLPFWKFLAEATFAWSTGHPRRPTGGRQKTVTKRNTGERSHPQHRGDPARRDSGTSDNRSGRRLGSLPSERAAISEGDDPEWTSPLHEPLELTVQGCRGVPNCPQSPGATRQKSVFSENCGTKSVPFAV
eukprot:GHVS01034333.1.p1 GENE.GHVS01034333.1~~GHVS01034333.1.p1  ORF type:complete len:284 (-),score=8.02 GHVS01034333.1:246-1097(-)